MMTFFKKIHPFYFIMAILFLLSLLFVTNNEAFYSDTIVDVTEVKEIAKEELVDGNGNKDRLYTLEITGEIQNGESKGTSITIEHQYSQSQAISYPLAKGDTFFLGDDGDSVGNLKRDVYIVLIGWLFILVLLFVGRKQGALSVLSLAVNAIILFVALDIYAQHPNINLLVICGISIVLFTILSLFMASGNSAKTYTAILATFICTSMSLLITFVAFYLTGEQGLRYEEMAFVSRHPQLIFLAGLLIGSLGAVMDVAITMASSMFELYEKNQAIKVSVLKKAGREIGRDIMGTMTNILFFAYVSGSIPMLLLYFKNGSPLDFTITVNLSMEIARALAGGIGIVLTIPITIYLSIFFIKRKQAIK